MKLATLLISTLIMSSGVLIAVPVLAQSGSLPAKEIEAKGQPFDHPSDDMAYAKDMRDDEMLAKAKSTDNGTIQYVSGGIAVSGMRAIDAEENNFNLKMLFVADGAYLADVSVSITDSSGKSILDATTKGPVLLAKMPAGHYTVNTKTAGGTVLTRKIEISADHLSSYVLRYPAKSNN